MVKLNLPRLPGHTSPALYWLSILFFLPLIVGIIAKLYRSKYIFSEYQSVACAGLKALQGAPIYALDLQCPGMRAASFVYLPGVAQVAAFLERLLTEPGFLMLYLVFYLAAAAALIYVPLFTRKTPGHWRDKLPFAVFLSSSAFMLGNIAVILHGLVLVGALAIEISPWLFIAAVAIAAWVKPTFLTYLMVILLLDIPLRRRIGLMASGVIIGLLPLGHFILTGGALTQQWYALLSHYVYEVTPGVGFFGWTSLIGLDPAHVSIKLAYLVFAGLITFSGLALVKGLQLNRRERIWLGLSLAALLIPRIMSEDICLIGPGLLILADKSANLAGQGQNAHRNGRGLILALCVFALAGAMTGLADYSEPIALLGLCLYVLWLGQHTIRTRLPHILAPYVTFARKSETAVN
ncbi:MAG: hypothetical protein NVV72_15930 [Asticcacaulis sp.]|nr:hypothetical protein [Asticcacaulis sp.]